AQAHCRYLRAAKYDDLLRVRTRIAETRNRTIRFSYEIFRDEHLLATGETTHVICGSNGRPKLLPEKYRSVFSAVVGKQAPPRTAIRVGAGTDPAPGDHQ
ncbi:MAG: thioesterase family protein, partial [Acidobacteriota bacterium]|nr:thioesterase family protein [Acidobacteriota bacterium]